MTFLYSYSFYPRGMSCDLCILHDGSCHGNLTEAVVDLVARVVCEVRPATLMHTTNYDSQSYPALFIKFTISYTFANKYVAIQENSHCNSHTYPQPFCQHRPFSNKNVVIQMYYLTGLTGQLTWKMCGIFACELLVIHMVGSAELNIVVSAG